MWLSFPVHEQEPGENSAIVHPTGLFTVGEVQALLPRKTKFDCSQLNEKPKYLTKPLGTKPDWQIFKSSKNVRKNFLGGIESRISPLHYQTRCR